MPKVVIPIRRKPGLTVQQFIDHYEHTHVPLATRHLGAHFIDYRRSYVVPGDPVSFSGTFDSPDSATQGPDFDVITEMWFADRASMEKMFEVAREPVIAAEIAADEERFMDRASVRVYVVDEHR